MGAEILSAHSRSCKGKQGGHVHPTAFVSRGGGRLHPTRVFGNYGVKEPSPLDAPQGRHRLRDKSIPKRQGLLAEIEHNAAYEALSHDLAQRAEAAEIRRG